MAAVYQKQPTGAIAFICSSTPDRTSASTMANRPARASGDDRVGDNQIAGRTRSELPIETWTGRGLCIGNRDF
jgi:hypothetical protein